MGWKIKQRERYALIEVDEANPRVHRGTFSIGPRHVKHHATKEFVEHVYVENPDFASEKDCRVFAQCSNIAVEVYDFYNKLFNPDYENVSVYDERFEVQYLFKEPDTWRSADYYNPRIEVTPLEDGVDIKKIFDTDYGTETLEITYTVRTGARLKYTIVFTNKTAEQKTFRVVMKLAGITSDKVKYRQTEEQITEEKHIVTPFLIFGEDNRHLALSEYLWSLGEEGENPGEWSATTLKNIILDTHVNGSKADIFIGNYTLTENESLLIDPDSDTWQVGAGTDDCIVYWLNGAAWTITTGDAQHGAGYFNANVNKMGGGMRWLNVTIPQGSTITAAYITLTSNAAQTATVVNTKIIGDDEDNAATFGTIANYQSRRGTSVGGANNNLRTTAEVLWDGIGNWALNTAYNSPEIKTVIQEIISRGGWSSGNALALFWDDHDVRGTQSAPRYRLSYAFNASPPNSPELTVTWTGAEFAEVLTETASLSDVCERLFSIQRRLIETASLSDPGILIIQDIAVMFSEIITLSDSVLKGIETHLMESVSLSGSLARILDLQRILAETATLSDVFLRTLVLQRIWTETITLSDVLTRQKTLYRVWAEALTSSDNILKEPQKILLEIATLSDAVQRLTILYRSLTEVGTLSDSIFKGVETELTESVTLSGVLARILDLQRILTEVASISDILLRRISLYKTLLEIGALSDTVVTTRVLIEILTETLILSDNILRQLAIYRILAEAASMSDTYERLISIRRLLTETVAISDSVFKGVETDLIETITLSDALLRISGLERILTEIITLSDALLRQLYSYKTLMEAATLSDNLLRVSSLYKILTDVMALTDVLEKIMASKKELIEALTLVDALTKTLILHKILSDPVSLTDELLKSPYKMLNESLLISDILVRISALQRTLTEIVTLSDNVLKGAGKKILETVALNDDLLHIWNLYKTLTENIAPSDALMRQLTLHRVLSDTLTPADILAWQLVLYRVLTETLTPVDAISRMPLKTLSEAITLSDTFLHTLAMQKILAETIRLTDIIHGVDKNIVMTLIIDMLERTRELIFPVKKIILKRD